MQPLKTYDYLVLSRQRIFEWVRPLSAEQYAREFPIAYGTLGRTMTHILASEWYYVKRIQRLDVPPYVQWPYQHEQPLQFAALEAAWTQQTVETRAALGAVRDWTTDLEYEAQGDDGPIFVSASPADIFTQLAFHEVHHRSQAMTILRQLGVVLADIDFNALMYKRSDA